MSKMIATLLLGPCLAFLAVAAPEQPDSKKAENDAKDAIKLPATFEGKIADNDAVDPIHNQPAKSHKLRLAAGKTYVIDMISSDFDTFLRLEDAAGKQLAEDDDGGQETNAQLVFTPEKTSDFKVIATRFEEGEGAYTLKIDELKYKVGKAQTIPKAGLSIDTKLDNTDAFDQLGGKQRFKLYSVKLDAGKTYTIDMTSGDFDSFLRLMDNRFKLLESDDDGGGNLDSRITFRPRENGVYHIIATTLDGDLGDFNLRVKADDKSDL
ncbi:MAG: PPC domain-containing protein [Gemmataceae bacterium]